jgi:23S rRNA pseudouridine2605 synthase
MQERLQKFLARAGLASRRKAEELIAQGRVVVNGKVVREPGTKVDGDRDTVVVDGKPAFAREGQRTFLLYKPPGCVTTLSDPQGRPTAAEYLRGVPDRVFPVGRLDYDAEGAVLFTTDGELANRLAHPRYGHRRVYLVKVKGGDDARLEEALTRLIVGVRLEDGPAKALSAQVHERAEKNVWVRIEVGEGRFHLVKRLCESVGLQVQRLFRPEFGGVSVEGLRPGQFREVEPGELREMRRGVGLDGGAAGSGATLPVASLPRAARRHGHGPPAPPASEPAGQPAPPEAPRRGSRPRARARRRRP